MKYIIFLKDFTCQIFTQFKVLLNNKVVCLLQVTKSVIALLKYYDWRKFTIITEDAWQTVAKSLDLEAKEANLTVQEYRTVQDSYKCCTEQLNCCNSAYWYQVVQETKNKTRSK